MKNKINYLLIDTSSLTAQIALADDEKVIAKESWEVLRSLSDNLLPNIEKMFLDCHSGDQRGTREARIERIDSGQARLDSESKRARMTIEDLTGIIIYLGPGTYTGLRVGVTVANALAYSLNIPIAGVKGKSFGKEKFIVSELKPIDPEILLKKGKKILASKSAKSVTPFYGKKPNVG